MGFWVMGHDCNRTIELNIRITINDSIWAYTGDSFQKSLQFVLPDETVLDI